MRSIVISGIVAALVAASSSTAVTLVVTSKNIKDGTIQVVDVSKKAQRAFKGNRGPQGLQGADGPQGAAGATNVTVRSSDFTVASFGDASGFTLCPSGQRATGGGVRAGAGVEVYATQPTNGTGDPAAQGDTPAGWRGGVDNFIPGSQSFTVYAICAAP